MKSNRIIINVLALAVLVSSVGTVFGVSNPFKSTYTFKNETPYRVVVTIQWHAQGTEDSVVSIPAHGQEQIGTYLDNIKRIDATLFTGQEPKGNIFAAINENIKGAVKAAPLKDEWVAGNATFKISGPSYGRYWITRVWGN